MTERDDLKIEDTSGLTDADWAEINKLRNAYKTGGKKALAAAWDQLAKDPIRYAVVAGAFYPKMVREALRDQMAEAGITEEDLRDLIRKLERRLEGDCARGSGSTASPS
jgi:hypothetical protein